MYDVGLFICEREFFIAVFGRHRPGSPTALSAITMRVFGRKKLLAVGWRDCYFAAGGQRLTCAWAISPPAIASKLRATTERESSKARPCEDLSHHTACGARRQPTALTKYICVSTQHQGFGQVKRLETRHRRIEYIDHHRRHNRNADIDFSSALP